MGKSVQSATEFHQFAARIVYRPAPAQLKPVLDFARLPISSPVPRPDSHRLWLKARRMEAAAENSDRRQRMPLAEVVGNCVKRWFQDTLKEAKTGDTTMQVLVGQMYYSGYGVARDSQKGRAWINRASKNRSSVWKVGDKHPGYNASDSDSDDVKEVAK